jgi:hypothetical protein
MANVIRLASGKHKKRIGPNEILFSAVDDLLHSNVKLARSVQELLASFAAVDTAVAGDSLDPHCRRYVDGVVKQDRQRLHAALREVLHATLEYTKGVEFRFRDGPKRLPGSGPAGAETARS